MEEGFLAQVRYTPTCSSSLRSGVITPTLRASAPPPLTVIHTTMHVLCVLPGGGDRTHAESG